MGDPRLLAKLRLSLRTLMSQEGLLGHSGHGKTFYVLGLDGQATDGNSGETPDDPILTLTHAISLCRDDKDDVIFVMDYWRPTGETWPISVNKNGIHIIGISRPGPLPYPAIHPAGETAAFQLTSSGQYVEIAGLTFGGGAAHGGIDWMNEGQVDGVWIHDCMFGHQWFGTPLAGIYQPDDASRGGYGNLIERCTFLGNDADCTGALTGNGVDMLGPVASYDLHVLDCIFKGCAVGINLTLVHNAALLRNKFICANSADGEAITLADGCLGCMVDGNVAMSGPGADWPATAKAPYKDAGSANHWGVNWENSEVDVPCA